LELIWCELRNVLSVAVQPGDKTRMKLRGITRILWARNVSLFYQWWSGSH